MPRSITCGITRKCICLVWQAAIRKPLVSFTQRLKDTRSTNNSFTEKVGNKVILCTTIRTKTKFKNWTQKKGISADGPGDMKIRKLSKKERPHNLTKNIKNNLANTGPKR